MIEATNQVGAGKKVTDRSGRVWEYAVYESPSGPAFWLTLPDELCPEWADTMTGTTEPVVSSILDLAAITHKPTRDALRQAATGTRAGPVWVTRRDGKRIAAIVSVEDAQFLAAVRREIHGTES